MKKNLKKYFKLFPVVFIMTLLYLPGNVSAYDAKSKIGNILTKVTNAYNSSKTSISKITTKAKQLNQLSIKITDSLNLNLNNPFKKESTNRPSQLIVKSGGKDVEKMLNNFSSKQYTVDKNGYVYRKSGVSENPSKSSEYSMIIDNLINGTKVTNIYLDNSTASGTYTNIPLLGNYIKVGTKAYKKNNNWHDTVLAHELIHSFREEKGLRTNFASIGTVVRRVQDKLTLKKDSVLSYFERCTADEEACTIQVENRICYKNGFQLTTDGSSFDDVNKDGKPDGDNSYGKYLNNTTGPNWFNNYLTKVKKNN